MVAYSSHTISVGASQGSAGFTTHAVRGGNLLRAMAHHRVLIGTWCRTQLGRHHEPHRSLPLLWVSYRPLPLLWVWVPRACKDASGRCARCDAPCPAVACLARAVAFRKPPWAARTDNTTRLHFRNFEVPTAAPALGCVGAVPTCRRWTTV